MRKEKKISLLLSSGILVCIISSCIITDQSIFTSDSTYYETTAATEQNLIEVVMPKSLLDFSGVTAQDTADIFYDMINDPISYIAEDVSVNDDRSLSFYCTQLDIEQTIANFEFFVEDDLNHARAYYVDEVSVDDDYTTLTIGVNSFETINSTFNLLPLWVDCSTIQIFTHPENPEWHLHLTFINTNTGIVGYECTIPDEVMYLDCQQFFIDTEDPDAFSPDEHVNNVIITTSDLSAVSTAPSVDISTYETWMPDEDLTEILIPSNLLSVAGTNASQMISSFYDPNTSTPFFAEGALSNEDESVSFYCTQGEIEETLDNLESYIQNRVNSANGNLVDSIEISDDYSEITIEVSDVQSFEDMFSLHDVWVYCATQQLFSHPDDPEWHLHITMINSETGLIGYECTLPDEDLNINSIDFFSNSSI